MRVPDTPASRLLQSGFRVLVWNRTREKAASLLSSGAVWAETPAEAARGAFAVIAMLADDAASSAAWFGPRGALDHLPAGSFAIECSTLSMPHVARIAAAANARGLRYIDCPVTGWPEAAAAGRLTLLTGADPAYKLMINLMGAVQIAALAEGLLLAERLGLDRETVIGAIENSAAASPQAIRHTRKMAERNFSADPPFTLALRHKDALYGLALADSVKSPVPLGAVAAHCFARAAGAGAGRDEAAVITAD
jgi:3-hydroxyisobutyrate dehydrogenase